jgi:glutamate decarboxylase
MTLHQTGASVTPEGDEKFLAQRKDATHNPDSGLHWIDAIEGQGALDLENGQIPDGPMPGEVAYQTVSEESMLDGNARLNLATFVSTWMDDYARKLYAESYDKNMIDKDEYPQTAAIEQKCARIIANLWHAPEDSMGTSTIGSSEACMLAGMALKRRWQNARKAKGLSTDKPNLVMSSAVQVVWEKFCNYWEVEAHFVPITEEHMLLTPEGMLDAIDENTIGVVGILGQTYTGGYEPIKELAEALDDLEKRTGQDVPLHVDAASGGMVAPFIQADLVWDFQLPRVHSINTSGHKYGMVYPGLGWVIWRKAEYVPADLIFHVSYLGGDMPTLALNFSRPGAQVLLQFYLFARLGRSGYTAVQQLSQDMALHVSKAIGEMAPFELITKGDDLPVFCWKMKKGYTDNWDLKNLSERLRLKGWQIPAYPLADNLSDQWVMRIVVRTGMLPTQMDLLIEQIGEAVTFLDALEGPMPREGRTGKPTHFTYN